MKKSNLAEIKILEGVALLTKIKKAKVELANLIFEKNMKKLKDLKSVFKKRKEIALMLTIFRQKELLKKLEIKK